MTNINIKFDIEQTSSQICNFDIPITIKALSKNELINQIEKIKTDLDRMCKIACNKFDKYKSKAFPTKPDNQRIQIIN